MPNYRDYLELQERTRPIEPKRVEVLPRLADLTHKAQTVVDHSGWQLLLDGIESRVKAIEMRRLQSINRMINGTELGHDLELLKINVSVMDAEIAGLKYASSLIPEVLASSGEPR